MKENGDLYSKYRTKVIKSLEEDVKIPTAIANDSGIRTNYISNVLSELKYMNLLIAFIQMLEMVDYIY